MVDRFSSGPYGRHGGLPLRRNGGLANTTILWRKDPGKLHLSLQNQRVQNRCHLLMTILGEPMKKKDKWQTCIEHFINLIGHF